MWSIVTFTLLRKTWNILTKRWGTAFKLLKFCFYEQACSEKRLCKCESSPKWKAIKITKSLALEKKSKIILWWKWGCCVNHITKLHVTNISKVKGERSYKHELTSNLLIYQNRFYCYSQPCLIIPITKQTKQFVC